MAPKKTKAKAKRGRGRPRIVLDLDKVEFCGRMACTDEEIAAYLGVSPRTISSRKAELQDAIERGYNNGNVSLRVAQMKNALSGDRTMQIWLGKQRLGQKDKVERTELVAEVPTIYVEFEDGPADINDLGPASGTDNGESGRGEEKST